jgi:hypothetical protein
LCCAGCEKQKEHSILIGHKATGFCQRCQVHLCTCPRTLFQGLSCFDVWHSAPKFQNMHCGDKEEITQILITLKQSFVDPKEAHNSGDDDQLPPDKVNTTTESKYKRSIVSHEIDEDEYIQSEDDTTTTQSRRKRLSYGEEDLEYSPRALARTRRRLISEEEEEERLPSQEENSQARVKRARRISITSILKNSQ